MFGALFHAILQPHVPMAKLAAALQLTAGDHLPQRTASTRKLQLQQATAELLVLIDSPLTAFGIAFDECCFSWHQLRQSDRTFTGVLQRCLAAIMS